MGVQRAHARETIMVDGTAHVDTRNVFSIDADSIAIMYVVYLNSP